MFTVEVIESLLFIAAIAAAVVIYGIVHGRKEGRNTGQRAGHDTTGERLAS